MVYLQSESTKERFSYHNSIAYMTRHFCISQLELHICRIFYHMPDLDVL